ncbi:bile acid-CoA:amino acid N-acyltransferase-like isoform 2-T2 [Clarias gariepinus]|uniref:bile acid-CoA:amino acid N-acyltransferase-like isoform X1 n=2 Tax=Clarias gariepinus TaxID=13013 RepID=UPI00234D95AB|nr:bile acid-CoA:amino acid N-acyltransferase-like isoform X1 [Clarias gariepinus]
MSQASSRMMGSCPCPLLSVEPRRGLVDEKIRILVTNLTPSQEVTLHCLHQSEDKDFWEAFGHYVSDECGTVAVAKDPSVGGMYTGVEPMALMWSLRPVPGSQTGLRLQRRDVLSPMIFHISVYDGHITQDFNQLTPLVITIIERWYMAPGVQCFDVHEKGVRGSLFIPPGPGPFPAILDLWGGGRILMRYRAALLASHGFVAFSLDYVENLKFSEKGIDITYFEVACQIMQDHPKVLRDRVALWGISVGGSVVLTMAAFSSVIKPRCCICISCSHVIPIRDTLSEFYARMNRGYKARVKDNQVIWRDVVLPIPTDLAEKVDVGRIKCPLLLVVGDDDQNLGAVECAEDMERMTEKAGNRHLFNILIYPGAGHLIEPPYSPHHRASNYMLSEEKKVIMLWGGQTRPHAYAQEDSWEKILDFLQQHLCNATPRARL